MHFNQLSTKEKIVELEKLIIAYDFSKEELLAVLKECLKYSNPLPRDARDAIRDLKLKYAEEMLQSPTNPAE